jgi:sugar transferase EpsL
MAAGSLGGWAKRALDICAAGAALVVLSPVLAAVALSCAMSGGGPILFRQVRPGLKGRPFQILKFRTMRPALQAGAAGMDDAARITRLGRMLRASSLDELPELWNVVRGEMSLVGPRPLLMSYLPLYSPEQARRHDVRPGLTGWAQVHGRNAVDWEARLALDVWYVDHRSLWLDVKIIARTLVLVLRRQGISAEGHATMPAFTGSASPGGAEP